MVERRDSGLSWPEFLPSETGVDQFLADNSLEWTLAPGAAPTNLPALADYQTVKPQNQERAMSDSANRSESQTGSSLMGTSELPRLAEEHEQVLPYILS